MKKIIIGLFLVLLCVQSLSFAAEPIEYDVWYKHPDNKEVLTAQQVYGTTCIDTDCIKRRFEAGTIFLVPTADKFGFERFLRWCKACKYKFVRMTEIHTKRLNPRFDCLCG